MVLHSRYEELLLASVCTPGRQGKKVQSQWVEGYGCSQVECLMETVLRGLPRESYLIYLDDAIAIGPTFEERLINLRKVF